MGFKILYLITVCFLCVILADQDTFIYEDDGDMGPLSNDCIKCMCEVVGCPNDNLSCENNCGPFHITYGYWQIAFGKPDNKIQEYKRCTSNAWCSVRTVQNYMQRKLWGCIGNTSPDDPRSVCEIAMVLHAHGESKCNTSDASAEYTYFPRKIRECMDRRARKWLSSDC